MGDLALAWGFGVSDLSIVSDDVEQDEGLKTATLLSLFTDRRASESDTLPSKSKDRRGWWGDQFHENPEDQIGSKLWLLSRSTAKDDLIPLVESHDRDALQWMLDDCVATAIDVEIELAGDQLQHAITIYRGKIATCFRFGHAWEAEA